MAHQLLIRPFQTSDAISLFQVFYSAIHQTAIHDYSTEQCNAWAPKDMDMTHWKEQMTCLKPFVVEANQRIVGYADLQTNGYIDHFFVHHEFAHQGIGSKLMHHLIQHARKIELGELTADVSKTAEAFFTSHGFAVMTRQFPVRNGLTLPNAAMKKVLSDAF